MTGFFQGIRYYGKANQVIFKYNLWRYMIIPGILSLLYVLILLIFGAVYFSDISAYIAQNWLPEFMKSGIMRIVTSIMLWIFLLLTAYITYKPVIMILFSPILGYLSEVVEKSVYNAAIPDFDIREMLRLAVRGLYLNLRNLAFMIAFSLMAWILALIPLLGVLISPIVLMLIQFYYDGFGLMDYTLERKGLSAEDSIRFAKTHRAKVMGVGSGFMVLMMIPFLGWFTAPSYGTVAATLAALEMTAQT